MCSFESVADQFYYAWRRTMAVEEPIRDRNRELYSLHDFNKKLMSAVIIQIVGDIRSPDGRIEVLKTYTIPDCSTEDMARAIRFDFPTRTIQSVMDMSGSQINRDTTSPFGVTDKTILEKYGFRIINSRNSNPMVSDTDNSSNAFINQGRLTIWQGETKLLDALETYHYEDANRKKLVKYADAKYAHIDSLGDCIRYGIHHFFPMVHDHSGGAEYIDGMERFDLEPGFQYLTETNIPKSRDGVPEVSWMIKKFEDELHGNSENIW